MTGALWAAAAGLGFGAFQAVNRRAVGGLADPYVSTFLQLVVALAVLVALTLGSEDIGVLGDATALGIGYFVAAGVVHFALGWTLLNMSQMRIGAARSSPLFSTNPLWGVFLAAVWLRELPRAVVWAGLLLITAGALAVSLERVSETGWDVGWRDALPGLGTALSWAISPILVKEGLEGLSSPLLGLTLGMAAAVLLYGAGLAARPRPNGWAVSREALWLKLAGGLLVGFSVWARWEALDFATVAVVLALGLLSVPVVLVLSPILMGRAVERVTVSVWGGAALVVGGSLLLVLV